MRHSRKKRGNRKVLSFLRWIHNWFHNSMLTEPLGDLTTNAMHGPTIRILKVSICNAYMSI